MCSLHDAEPNARLADVPIGRDGRQKIVADWCAAAFGADQAGNIEQRGIRLLEEAIELYQACGGSQAMAENLVAFIFRRPAGEIAQELGGVGVTALTLASAAGLSADLAEANEVARVLAKPLEHFAARNRAKNDAGFRAADPCPDYGPGRCEVCGWPLAESADKGCVTGDCSYRPHAGTAECARIEKRRAALAAKKAGQQPAQPPREMHYVEDARAPGKLAGHPRKRDID